MAGGDNLPRNFSWIQVNQLAGSCCPQSELELRTLVGLRIHYIVTLSPECLPPPCLRTYTTLEHTVIAVPDRRGATIQDFEHFFRICNAARREDKGVLVHCRSGRGRTGMFIAAFFIKYKDMDAVTATATVRSMRPCSIETKEQELALALLQDSLLVKSAP